MKPIPAGEHEVLSGNREVPGRPPVPPGGPRSPGIGLSAKLLLVTLAAVMAAEVFVFLPSVANFRKNWLMARLTAAQIASLAGEVAGSSALPAKLRDELLITAQVRSVAVKRKDRRLLILQEDMPATIAGHFDLASRSYWGLIVDAIDVFFHPGERIISVRGQPELGRGEFVEIVVSEAPLRAAMIDYGLNILGLSIIISGFAAVLVYIALNSFLVRPMTRMMRNMVHFGEDPEDATRIIRPSERRDEIGTAEAELAHMQGQLTQMLKQKARLAALGLAVSKVNHDLRNMLASAQLISDRFATIDDATVQRFAPKLINSLDRAIRLCTQTLRFGRAKEPPPERTTFALRDLVDEVGESLALPREGRVGWRVEIGRELELFGDRDQMFRVLANLVRNAAEAVAGAGDNEPGEIAVKALRCEDGIEIEVHDTGPGVPQEAREHLFEAFQGSARQGGTGLGLVIAAELVQAHGGSLTLAGEGSGTTFLITIPDQ